MDKELFVKNIYELCKKNNISPSQLENELGFGSGLISRWKERSASIERVLDIADYFHVSLDALIGRKYFTKDEFITSLISMTESGSTIWKSCTKKECKAKRYSQDISDDFKEKTYFTRYFDGYVSIYALYKNDDVINPAEIKLFLQPDDESDLIIQKYKTEDLSSLWLSILGSVDKSNKELKAANMKKQISDKNYFVIIPNRNTRFEHSLSTSNWIKLLNEKHGDTNMTNYSSSIANYINNNDNDRFFEAIKLLLEWKHNLEEKHDSKDE